MCFCIHYNVELVLTKDSHGSPFEPHPHYETKTHENLVKILMGKSQGFHVILTRFSWFNSWDFSHGNPMKKTLKIL